MINKVIVTGSAGMLGSALINRMKHDKQLEIIAVTSQVEKLKKIYHDYKNIIVVNSLNRMGVNSSCICVHCAFPRTQDGETLSNAIITTEQMIDSLSLFNCRYIINISSQSVYAQNGDEIQSEDNPVSPSNFYGITKFAIEQIVRLVCEKYGMNFINLRLGSLASTKFDQRIINRFFYKIVNGEDIYIDDGLPKVSYLHIEDAVSGLVKLISHIRNSYAVDDLYNLANNDWMLVKDLAVKCIDFAKQFNIGTSRIRISEKKSNYNNVINSSKFYQHFDWQPKYTMAKIIEDIYINKMNNRDD